MPLSRNEVIPFLVQQLQNQSFKDIRANVDNYPTPKAIVWEKGARKYFPDITAKKEDAIGLFSIVEKPSEIAQSEWERLQLFSAFTAQRKGKHFLVTEKSHVKELTNLCETHSVQAEVLPIVRSNNG